MHPGQVNEAEDNSREAEVAAPPLAPLWPAPWLVLAFAVLWILALMMTTCLCHRGAAKAGAISIAMWLICLRFFFAMVRKERSRTWIVYVILAALLGPLTLTIEDWFGSH